MEGNVASARLYISGLGFYECYLNGRKIKGRLLRDPRGDFGVRGGDDIEFSIHREDGDVIRVAQF